VLSLSSITPSLTSRSCRRCNGAVNGHFERPGLSPAVNHKRKWRHFCLVECHVHTQHITTALEYNTPILRDLHWLRSPRWFQVSCAHLPMPVRPGATVSFRLHPERRRFQPSPSPVVVILAASDPTYTAVHCWWSCISGCRMPPLEQSAAQRHLSFNARPICFFRNRLKTHLFFRSFPS